MNKSNPSKHIKDNLHSHRGVLHCSGKITPNEQLEPDRLNLFRNGVTWLHYSVNILNTWVFKF